MDRRWFTIGGNAQSFRSRAVPAPRRVDSRMIRSLRAAVAGLAALAVLALFPLPFYVICGVQRHCGGAWLWVQTAIALVIALAAVVVWVKFGITPQPVANDEQDAARAAFEAERAEHLRYVDTFRDDPLLSRWVPLASRYLRVTETNLREWEARYQAVLAHPTRAWAAPRLLDGYFMTDLEIDYERDPAMRVTCVHLRVLEGGLRDAGVRVVARIPLHVDAWAMIHFARAKARFALAPCVIEEYVPEHPHTPAEDYVRCTECGSSIQSVAGPEFPPR
jgi:hypothetical protein